MSFDERLRHLPLSRSGDRAPRFDINVVVSAETSQSREQFDGKCCNISRTGVQISLKTRVPLRWRIGDRVELRIAPDGYYLRETVTITAEIIRLEAVHEAGDGPEQLVALRFLPG